MPVTFDSDGRAMIGEDGLERIREYMASDTAPDSPLRDIAREYLATGAHGPFVDRLVFASLCDLVQEMDARIKALERDED